MDTAILFNTITEADLTLQRKIMKHSYSFVCTSLFTEHVMHVHNVWHVVLITYNTHIYIYKIHTGTVYIYLR